MDVRARLGPGVGRAGLLYDYNMPPKDIEKQIDEARRLGFEIRRLSSRGHTWGWISCPPCDEHVKVFSSGKNPTGGAKVVARFIRKHIGHINQQKGGEQ